MTSETDEMANQVKYKADDYDEGTLVILPHQQSSGGLIDKLNDD